MKKLEWNVDTLKVQTFQTVPEAASGGTVVGAEAVANMMGTRATRCYGECTVCTYTQCHSNERTEIDCVC